MEFQFMKNAFLGILLISPLFGLVGTMIVNNKMSFFSDALGHSALTGIAVGVLLGVEDYIVSMLGFALLIALGISAVIDSGISSADTVIGVFSSAGIALGIVLLSLRGGFAKYSGYLTGDILSITPGELLWLLFIFLLVLLLWIFAFNRLLLSSVSADLALSKQINVTLVRRLFCLLIALIVSISIKWVGILIINSLLVLPAASARNLARGMRSYHALSVAFSVFSGLFGLILSYYLGTAAGGTIVLVSAVLFFVTFLLNRLRAGRQ